jgi:uncharacterized membrane protein YedE/YeeE
LKTCLPAGGLQIAEFKVVGRRPFCTASRKEAAVADHVPPQPRPSIIRPRPDKTWDEAVSARHLSSRKILRQMAASPGISESVRQRMFTQVQATKKLAAKNIVIGGLIFIVGIAIFFAAVFLSTVLPGERHFLTHYIIFGVVFVGLAQLTRGLAQIVQAGKLERAANDAPARATDPADLEDIPMAKVVESPPAAGPADPPRLQG